MKCVFVVDVDVDLSTMPADQKPKIKWRRSVNRQTRKPRMEAYFPAGTEYEHDNAAFFVDHGMALPADAECEGACTPMTPEQRAKLEMEYKATAAGIQDPNDRELFFAGAIAGYETVNGRTAYLPGPNWDAFNAQEKAAEVAKAASDV